MDDYLRQLVEIYGFNRALPFAFQFPRVPPGFIHPMTRISHPIKQTIQQQNESLKTRLEDFQRMYQKYVTGLTDLDFSGFIQPGHPLYSRQTSIEILQLEKDKLLKENLELKKQLDKINREKSP